MTALSEHFRHVREKERIPLSTLARALGYTNLSKGANRIRHFEDTGELPPHLLLPLATALGISLATLRDLKAQERQAKEQWASETVDPYLVIRLMPAICGKKELPKGISRERAERTSSVIARRLKMKVALIWNRKTSIPFDEHGNRLKETD